MFLKEQTNSGLTYTPISFTINHQGSFLIWQQLNQIYFYTFSLAPYPQRVGFPLPLSPCSSNRKAETPLKDISAKSLNPMLS
jgi:hypothetical protein